MTAKHIFIIVIALVILSAIPLYFGTRAPGGTPPITPPGSAPVPAPPPTPLTAPAPAPAAPKLPAPPAPAPKPTPPAIPPPVPPQAAPKPASAPPPSAGSPAPAPANQSVSIANFAFPSTVTVRRGAAVTWTNSDTVPHTVTSDTAGRFDSGLMNSGATFSFTFTAAGSFAYHCAFHPAMRGTIVVTE